MKLARRDPSLETLKTRPQQPPSRPSTAPPLLNLPSPTTLLEWATVAQKHIADALAQRSPTPSLNEKTGFEDVQGRFDFV